MDQENVQGAPQGDAPTPLADIVGKRRPEAAPPPAGQQAAPPPPAPAPSKGEPEAPKPEAAAQPRAEDGKFAPKDKEAAPPAEDDARQTAPIAALKDERAKRQAAEAARQKAEADAARVLAEMEAIKREIAALRTQPPAMPQPMPQAAPQPQQQAPDFWQDPDAHIAHRLNEREQALRQEMLTQRLNMSENLARARYQDYEAALNEFAEAMRANPMLQQQMVNAPDPGEFAYRVGKRAMEVKPLLADPEGYRSKLEAELRAKLEAEYAARLAAQPAPEPAPPPPAPLPPLPTSLASVRSVAARTGPQWTGPAPLDAIIGPRARSAVRPR